MDIFFIINFGMYFSSEQIRDHIPGLASRIGNPLKFLGLLETSNDACMRNHIPAINIAGTATEEQVCRWLYYLFTLH